jgi:hypothetical protein
MLSSVFNENTNDKVTKFGSRNVIDQTHKCQVNWGDIQGFCTCTINDWQTEKRKLSQQKKQDLNRSCF